MSPALIEERIIMGSFEIEKKNKIFSISKNPILIRSSIRAGLICRPHTPSAGFNVFFSNVVGVVG